MPLDARGRLRNKKAPKTGLPAEFRMTPDLLGQGPMQNVASAATSRAVAAFLHITFHFVYPPVYPKQKVPPHSAYFLPCQTGAEYGTTPIGEFCGWGMVARHWTRPCEISRKDPPDKKEGSLGHVSPRQKSGLIAPAPLICPGRTRS